MYEKLVLANSLFYEFSCWRVSIRHHYKKLPGKNLKRPGSTKQTRSSVLNSINPGDSLMQATKAKVLCPAYPNRYCGDQIRYLATPTKPDDPSIVPELLYACDIIISLL
jgi:hypothetical protein